MNHLDPGGGSLKSHRWQLFQSFGFSIGLALATVGWVRPELPVAIDTAAPAESRLEYVLVLVNDEPHMVNRNSQLTVLWGDKLEMRQAKVSHPESQPSVKIHVYGYSRRPVGSFDDRGREFFSEHLQAKYSEGGKGEVYAVVASTAGRPSGAVFLRVVAPELAFAEVKVNGRKQLVRAGEALNMRRSDTLQVERVVTNIPGNRGVLVQMAPAGSGVQAAMHFLRGGRVFASIPFKVGG